MTVGERIKNLREKLGMSQVDFADKINVSKQTLYKYENDIITNIPSDKIEAAASIGNISPAILMGWDFSEFWENEKYREMDFHEFIHGYLGYDSPYTSDGYVDIVLKKEPEVIYKVSAKEYDDFYEFTKDRIDREFDFLLNKAQKIQKGNKTTVIPLNTKDASHLDVNAARPRTDLNSGDMTDEMKQHDEDIMDDPNF